MKLKMYEVGILPTPLYGADIWMAYMKQARELNHLHLICLLRILKMGRQVRIPDMDVQERMGDPQHLFYAETTTNTLGRPPPPADQAGKLVRPRLRPTCLEENNQGRCSCLRSRPYHRRQSQTRGANLNCRRPGRLKTPTSNRLQRAYDASGHSGRHLYFLDSSGSTAQIFIVPSTSPSPPTPSTYVDHLPQPPSPLPSSPSSSSSSSSITTTTSTSAAVASAIPINNTHNPDTSTNANTTTNRDPVYICPQCDRTFTPHIGLVRLLRIHRTETGEQVPGAPTYTRRIRLTVDIALSHSFTAWVY
ncbi:hypothetical protein SprV_0200629200 [Sparganum proliferum]